MTTLALDAKLTIGTAQAAKWMAAVLAYAPLTGTPLAESPQRVIASPMATRTSTSLAPLDAAYVGSFIALPTIEVSERPTTPVEEIIGQLREWALLSANWDGEQALAPNPSSLRQAIAFVSFLSSDKELPEPMLLASGHAGLYWEYERLYADLEFIGDGRVTYYIEHPGEGKHKGVVHCDFQAMPAVFSTLIDSRLA